MGWESVGEEDEAGFLEAVDLDVGRTWEEEEEEDDEDCREEREVMLSLFMGERGSAGGEEIGEVDGLLAGDSSIRLLCSMLPELSIVRLIRLCMFFIYLDCSLRAMALQSLCDRLPQPFSLVSLLDCSG